jgi:DNA-binding MarR family transcriptional regulator
MAGTGLASVEDILCRIDNLLSLVEEVPGPDLTSVDGGTVEAARNALQAEQDRARLFGADMFPNPGWAILLHLFVAGAEGEEVDSGALCAAAGVPDTVALRHLAVMVAAKLVTRRPHSNNPGATYLTLTPAGETALSDYFSRTPGARDAVAA